MIAHAVRGDLAGMSQPRWFVNSTDGFTAGDERMRAQFDFAGPREVIRMITVRVRNESR